MISGYVEIEVPMKSREDCNAAASSLAVDEVGHPRGLSSRIECLGDTLRYRLSYNLEEERLLSLASTLDDFLANLKIILQLPTQ